MAVFGLVSSTKKKKQKKSGKSLATFSKHLLHNKREAKKKANTCEFC